MVITETYPDLTFNNYEEFAEWCLEKGDVVCSREKFNTLAGQTITLPTARTTTEHEEWIHHQDMAKYLVKNKIVQKIIHQCHICNTDLTEKDCAIFTDSRCCMSCSDKWKSESKKLRELLEK